MSRLARLKAAQQAGRAEGLPRTVRQWRALATLSQYRHLHADAEAELAGGGRVLDWGCGNGHFAWWLSRMDGVAVDAFSFEPRPPALAARPAVAHTQGDPREPVALPYPDARFDVVFGVGVLEHVWQVGGDETASLREIRRVLKPGGRFVCHHFPNRHGWIEPVSRALGGAARGLGGRGTFHFRKYRRAEIRALCDAAGVELLRTRRYNMIPRNMLVRVPAALSDSVAGTAAIDAADDALAAVLGLFAQNHAFVARRPA